MKRYVLLVAVVVVLVAIWVFWRSGRNAATERALEVTRARAESGDAVSPLADVPETTQERSVLRGLDPVAETLFVAPPIVQRGFEVLVVDAFSQAPVPGADVRVADAPGNPAIDGSDRLWLHASVLIASIETDGERFNADEHGRLQLPEIRRHTTLFGRLDDRLGIVHVDPETPPPVLLELHRDFDVVVQVVDPDGAPLAGVPVALSFGNEWIMREAETAITDGPYALATLRHAGLALALNEDERGFAALAGLFDPPVRTALEARDPPPGPVTLVAPPSGELEILTRRADGTLDLESARLRVEIVRGSGADGEEAYSTAWLGSMHDGRIVIPRVMLGKRFHAGASRAGTNLYATTEGAGPTLPGERATLTIETEFGARSPVLVARLLNEQGQPLAAIPILVGTSVGEPPKSHGFQMLATDRSGRFHMSVWQPPDKLPATDVLIGQADATRRALCIAFARAPLRTALLPGETDLGDIVLTRGPLLVSGRVVDEQSRPVGGARISISADGPWGGFWPNGIQGRSDDSGHFEVRGLSWAERFFAFAELEGALSPRTPFQLGATDVDLVVVRTGEIAGVIQLKPPLKIRDLAIRGQREDGDGRATRAPDIESNGAFRLRGLVAGSYHVTVGLENESSDSLDVTSAGDMEFAGLRVIGGETLRPPQLNPLDLSTRIHLHGLTARDPDGVLITGLDVIWRPAGQRASEDDASQYFDNGRARIVSLHERIDVDLAASRMRTVHVKDLVGDREIVMQRGVRVRLKLRDDAPLPDAPFTLGPILAPTPDSLDRSDWSAMDFSPSREAFVDAAESGRREVHFIVYKGGQSRPEAVIRPGPPQFVTIADEPDEQTFEVTISEAELQRGIAAYPR